MAEGDAPTVTAVTPTWVPVHGGVEVTMTGSDFAGTTDVAFEDLVATFTVDSDTQIRATAPDAGQKYTSSSSLPVVVTTPAGTARSSDGVQFGDPAN
ncbi:MAG TPA: IPT/TIG domain-containing protein [Acidimicrobiales bacterium]|nr:IPT/TIG domain-containing protein [Acidimicrobiales bacterium]